MTRGKRLAVLGLCAVLAAGSIFTIGSEGAAPAKPGAVAGRTPEAILKDLGVVQDKVQALMPSLTAVTDAKYRASDDAKKAVPELKKMVALFRELEGVAPSDDAKTSVRMNRFRFMALASALGDKDSTAELETAAKAKGPEGISGASALTLSRWLTTRDEAGQAKLLEQYAAIAKENPTNEEVASTLGFMSNVAVNDKMGRQVVEAMRANLKGEAVTQMLAQIDAEQAQKDMIGKPLAFEGRTSTGGKFNSAQLKGKVVLVDFWATWCGPCIAELPNVKAAYKEYHDKGFEIVGVSCDSADAELNKFAQENQMTWVQLREESQTEASNWHPLTKKYGVLGIPTMFLIDRQGVLRFVDAREDLAGKVKTLLAEGPGAAH
jgi:thiol-disulfide isomerase/thioredoxin